MRPKVNTWINWSAKELEDLVNQKNSCVFKETIRKHIPMYSVHLSDVRKSFKDILNSSINTFDSSFDGLLISYQNPTILCPLTQMFYDVQFVHVDLQADFYIFRPTVDSILTGIVNKKETNYIGVLMHKTFNVSITKRSNDECWLGHNVVVGDRVTFRVTLVDLKAKVPFIRGELLSSETTENDEQMDFAEEEIHEEGGTERDSGYQESENETKPSKSKITNGFLVGTGSDFENEEHTRKAKKKKIKSPEKIQSPIKVAKKRKRDYDNDDVSPKKETQTKIKRLKVDHQVKTEEESINMQKELSASPSHSVIGSDKPRIIHDEVLPNRSVNIKLENNVEKKTKKKKVSHYSSESDEDQSSQSSSITNQEQKQEKNDDDDDEDDDDVPHDHSQSFGLKESPITTSDDEQKALKVEESINEFSQKKLENKNEKKSKKKKAQNVINSQKDQFQSQSPSRETDSQREKNDDDDGDIPHDHSQYFGHKELPTPNSDDEPETPKVKESVIKSPKKKRKSNDEKKSKKKKAEIGARSQEDPFQSQSQSRETYSQEEKDDNDDDDDDDDDMPRDHSQYFARKESPISTSDDEAEVPKIKKSIDKSPQKELKDKKSPKKMAEGAIKSIENQSQSSRVDSQEGEENDFPHDHSQFVREKLLTPNDDLESETPEAQAIKPVAKKPKKKVEKKSQEEAESESLSSEKVVKKKVEKKSTAKKEPIELSPEEAEKLEKLREHYAKSIDQAIIKMCAENCEDEELEEHTNNEFLEDNFEEHLNIDTAKREKISKSKEIKKAKPLGNSTIIESQLDSPGFSRVQEPSVSPVIPEFKVKKSKTKDVVQSHELQSSDCNVKSSEETDSVLKKVKKSKKSKEKTSEVDTGVNILTSDVKKSKKTKKSKTKEFIEPQVPQTESDSGAKKSKSKKSNFVTDLKIKEEPASDAEGSHKKSKSKHKEADKSNNVSKKITIKQEVIIKQEDKKSGKRKNKDDTINLSDVKFEAASDTEGPAAKKKIHKLVFTE